MFASRLKTVADLAALGEDSRFELIDGVIVEKAAPLFKHASTQAEITSWVLPHFRRSPPGGGSGWWIGTEAHIELAPSRVVCPDVAGWRKDIHPTLPNDWPLRVVPEWVCEVLSDSNRAHDLATKLRLYAEAKIGHYWILDPDARTLTIYRWTDRGYLVALAATVEQVVRPEPFEALEVKVATLFGQDD